MNLPKNTIKIQDKASQEILFECPLADKEKAYSYALFLEELDIDFEFKVPSLPETLSYSLDSSPCEFFNELIEEEIDSHLCLPCTEQKKP